ncbi:hypothetical protein F5B21DRAFT_505583 [Xylaria acuta]|nr:hypothetical protein F5B21DRAFT_505583 [Xylaria acuta]
MAFRLPTGGAPLPRTFRCRVCGQNKGPAAYSKSQLQKWYNKKRNDRENKVTPESIGLSCKDHNSDEREIRCHGPCDRVKVVGQFSKNQRNNPEPWCITCTEWRLSFDGTEVPDDLPNGPLVRHGDDGIRDNEEFVQEPFSALSDDEEDDDDDDFDDGASPYDRPTIVSSAVDRLEGYGDEAAGEDITTDAVLTTSYSMGISCWNGDTNDGRSDAGYGKSAATVIGTQSLSVAAMPGEVAHLTRLASGLGIQMSEDGVGGRPFAPAQKPMRPTKSNGCKQTNENQRPEKGNNKKWYKGDNRKVFPGNKKSFADRLEDGTEAAHDSDSPDEM